MDFVSAVFAIALGIILVLACLAMVVLIGFGIVMFTLWALAAGINAIFRS